MDIRRNRARRWMGAAVLLAAAAAAPSAQGGTCAECGPPSDGTFRTAMGALLRDYGDSPDYYEYDGGECEVSVGPASQRRVREELLAVGSGEAYQCPEGRCDSHVRYALTLTSEHEWHLTASVGAEFDAAIVLKVRAGLEGGVGGSTGVGSTTEITQDISAAYCHRLPWIAYFVIAEFEATAHYDIHRRFRWWIKNPSSGATVVASGDVYVDCMGGDATLTRLWPILAAVTTEDHRCATGCDGTPTYGRTWHPTLPPDVPPIDPWPAPPPSDGTGSPDASGSTPPVEPAPTDPVDPVSPTDPLAPKEPLAPDEPAPSADDPTAPVDPLAPDEPLPDDPLDPWVDDPLDPYKVNPYDGTDSCPPPDGGSW